MPTFAPIFGKRNLDTRNTIAESDYIVIWGNNPAVAMGGSESGEHGIGVVKDVLLQISKRERDLMRQVKACFDPHGIMNPGKGY